MAYFNYHAKVKNKIKQGKLTKYYFDKNYNGIGFALVLCFDEEKFPIREKCFEEYFELIGNLYNITLQGTICYTNYIFDK